MDDDFDNLMAMMDLNDFNDGECSDADSVAAPSEVSFFSDCEDDNLVAVSNGDEISMEGETTSESIPHAMVQTSSSGQLNTDEPVLAENEVSLQEQQTSCPPQNSRNELMILDIHRRHPVQCAESEMPSTPAILTSASTNPCPLNEPTATARNSQQSCGFTIVGDNIDKNFRPSYQRQDRQTKSVHYFHAYAAKNRVDISALSDAMPPAILSADVMLPDQSDVDKLLSDFETLTSRLVYCVL